MYNTVVFSRGPTACPQVEIGRCELLWKQYAHALMFSLIGAIIRIRRHVPWFWSKFNPKIQFCCFLLKKGLEFFWSGQKNRFLLYNILDKKDGIEKFEKFYIGQCCDWRKVLHGLYWWGSCGFGVNFAPITLLYWLWRALYVAFQISTSVFVWSYWKLENFAAWKLRSDSCPTWTSTNMADATFNPMTIL